MYLDFVYMYQYTKDTKYNDLILIKQKYQETGILWISGNTAWSIF